MKGLVRVAFVLAGGLLLLVALAPDQALALGTPQIVSINPPSGSPVGSNVCIRAGVNWDTEFRSMRIRFGNEGWQESAEIEFERCFGTGHLSAGWYTIRVEVARQGDNSWSSPAVAEASYELTASAPPPQPTPVPIPYGPNISEVSFSPSGGVQVGNNVGIHVRVDSSNPGAVSITPSCGNTQHAEHTVPEFDTTWYTQGCNAGTQSVRVCARHVNDPNWAYASCVDRSYPLSSPPNPVPLPTANLWADSTSITQGQCTQLRWETSNAHTVDIDGATVQASGSMQVCPTVTKRYSLRAVGTGEEATRSLTLAVSAAPAPTNLAPTPAQQIPTAVSGHCSTVGTTWTVGTVVALRAGVRIYEGPGLLYRAHTIVPEDNWAVEIIGGPRYTDGWQWWDTSRRACDPAGGTGWVPYLQVSGSGQPQGDSSPQPQAPEASSQMPPFDSGSPPEAGESGSLAPGVDLEQVSVELLQTGANLYQVAATAFQAAAGQCASIPDVRQRLACIVLVTADQATEPLVESLHKLLQELRMLD